MKRRSVLAPCCSPGRSPWPRRCWPPAGAATPRPARGPASSPRSTRCSTSRSGSSGDRADVTNLTQPGKEPHDLELDVRQTAAVADADVLLYERGFQAAVDDAVDQSDPRARRGRRAGRRPGRRRPALLARPDQAVAGRRRVRGAARRGRPGPRARRTPATSRRLQSDLATLDRDFRTGLAHCAISTIVVSHDAFGYLGRRYGLEVVGINGLSPDAEPSPAHIRELQDLIRVRQDHHGLLRAARQPEVRRQPRRRPRHPRRGARPDRGPERRDGRPGLPVPDAGEPGRPREGEHLLMSTPAVTVTDGAVELGGRPVLRGIDLSVGTGEVVAVLGANGSGKSTLVRTMMGLVPTCRGEVRLFGTPARRLPGLAAGRLRPAADQRRVGRARLRARGRRLRPAVAPPALRPAAPRRPRGRRGRHRGGRPDRQGPRRRLHAVRRPAAAGADRPRPGRRARPARPRRAHRRRRRAEPADLRRRAAHRWSSAARRSCWSPTSSARSATSSTARW